MTFLEEMFVSEAPFLELCIVVSVVATTAPTGTILSTMAPKWHLRSQKESIARRSPTCHSHLVNQVVIRLDT